MNVIGLSLGVLWGAAVSFLYLGWLRRGVARLSGPAARRPLRAMASRVLTTSALLVAAVWFGPASLVGALIGFSGGRSWRLAQEVRAGGR